MTPRAASGTFPEKLLKKLEKCEQRTSRERIPKGAVSEDQSLTTEVGSHSGQAFSIQKANLSLLQPLHNGVSGTGGIKA